MTVPFGVLFFFKAREGKSIWNSPNSIPVKLEGLLNRHDELLFKQMNDPNVCYLQVSPRRLARDSTRKHTPLVTVIATFLIALRMEITSLYSVTQPCASVWTNREQKSRRQPSYFQNFQLVILHQVR